MAEVSDRARWRYVLCSEFPSDSNLSAAIFAVSIQLLPSAAGPSGSASRHLRLGVDCPQSAVY